MNIAWDAFRLIDNNTSCVIFMMAHDTEDPQSNENQQYCARVREPAVHLESIRQKLSYRYYRNLDEFVNEMELLFANWIDFNGTEHRMFN